MCRRNKNCFMDKLSICTGYEEKKEKLSNGDVDIEINTFDNRNETKIKECTRCRRLEY